ncbi:hypothetical protein [uncultured Bacteroides sp.]|uniref:hypothetical protein n=1 Tax=uncultured Bacteroides sp. TaxID=162156 RepID=UPI00261C34EA|nr:hypothetical protein [uncultured Bacteroides sp.]
MIFHVGTAAGFFAEYTAMLNAMIYCLEHRIQFRLYADDANFGYHKGWNDYFESFCPEVHDKFHHKYNSLALPTFKRIFKYNKGGKLFNVLKWKFKATCQQKVGSMITFLKYRKRILLSHHVVFKKADHYTIPELGINGDYLQALRCMVDITWRMNDVVKAEIKELIENQNLPEEYIGCQIRGGDKITETQLVSPSYYIQLIKGQTTKDVFVLTDDYSIFQQARIEAPDFKWHTLCGPQEKGYVNSSFTSMNKDLKRQQMLRFLTSVEILRNARLFIGSITTGPSFFLLKMLYPHAVAVDFDINKLPQISCLPINERSELAEAYMKQRK